MNQSDKPLYVVIEQDTHVIEAFFTEEDANEQLKQWADLGLSPKKMTWDEWEELAKELETPADIFL
jgi:ABC-type glycerol-3-phosphate transport system substrate-binding protein